MKLFGYWHRESPSGNQHIIAPDLIRPPIAVPQDRLLSFRKLPFKERGVKEHPRRVVFEVEGWLEATKDYQQFRAAKADE